MQCVNFLNKMAFEVQLDTIVPPDAHDSAELSAPRPKFQPMVRKWT